MKLLNNVGLGVTLMACLMAACEPTGDEPEAVTLNVVSRGSQLVAVENAEGWQVTLDRFDVCVANLEFTQEGEAHASLLKRISDFLIPEAMAHPGHLAGGDVTGTLNGQWLISFLDAEQRLGDATLLEGDYNGVNLSYCVADATVGVTADNPVYGHHAYFSGVAQKGAATIQFTVQIDIVDTPKLWGGVFEMNVMSATTVTLALRPLTVDPFEGDTFFDGLDFGALDNDGDGVVAISAGIPAHNILMKTLMSHDHWSVVATNAQATGKAGI
ncbi:MAG: hypothetical protein JXX14_11095 [Deltaproteobacteria bacterium]|nr:hypothetical protein [Deltaproteobacteria bacterium]